MDRFLNSCEECRIIGLPACVLAPHVDDQIARLRPALILIDWGPLDDVGYRVRYSVAEDNFRLGRSVIADSVNPLQLTRDAWIGVADRTGATAIEFEINVNLDAVLAQLKQQRDRLNAAIAALEACYRQGNG